MNEERRTNRSSNTWIALGFLLKHRAPNGRAVLSDGEGLPLVASGLEQADADRLAAEVWATDGPILRTGSGFPVRMYTDAIPENEVTRLRADVVRLLAAV